MKPYRDKPVRLRPVTKLRLDAHRTGWGQNVEMQMGDGCEWRDVKTHPTKTNSGELAKCKGGRREGSVVLKR